MVNFIMAANSVVHFMGDKYSMDAETSEARDRRAVLTDGHGRQGNAAIADLNGYMLYFE